MRRSPSSRWLAGLSLGSLAGLAGLLSLAIAFTACEEEPGLALRPVELLDPAPTDPFETDPLLAAPPPPCADCVERRVELPGGDVVTVRAEREPALRLAPGDVAFVELANEGGDPLAAPGGAPDGAPPLALPEVPERFGVYAVLGESGREAWRAFAAEHARHWVLVEIGGEAVDLVRPLGWTRGVRIGVFEDEAAREAFVAGLPFERGTGP